MKYLLLLLVVMGLVFLSGVRKGRAGGQAPGPGADGRSRGPAAGRETAAVMMVSCAECGTHLPESEAFPGRGGHFCSADHRQRHEARQGHG